jgi:glycosyltransferase involved in cell wall biosynthesis
MMKISIITAVLNGRTTIGDTVRSVLNQTYKNFEHIIIDGGSTDETVEVIKRYTDGTAKIISEPDQGIYDALNKGLRISSGDVVGILNGDDLYAHDRVLDLVADVFENRRVDSCYGDLQYIDRKDTNKVIRHWKSSEYRHGKFRCGWMPPHPTFFVKRGIYEKFGYFNTNFRIAADYELMLRFLEGNRITTHYIPHVLIKMRVGGVSNRSLRNIVLKSYEDYKAWRVNQLNRHFYTILFKNLSKIPQFLPGRG